MLQYQTRNGVFGRSANGSGIFNNAISGLGSAASDAAAMQTAMQTGGMQKGIVPGVPGGASAAASQTEINAKLSKLGICPIGVDGKVGPTTCAAADLTVTPIAACSGVARNWPFAQKNPPCAPTGGGVAPGPAVSPTAAQAAMYQPGGFKLDQKTIAIAVGGVAAAAFVYLYMTKKKKG